jgi:hypothetical protein
MSKILPPYHARISNPFPDYFLAFLVGTFSINQVVLIISCANTRRFFLSPCITFIPFNFFYLIIRVMNEDHRAFLPFESILSKLFASHRIPIDDQAIDKKVKPYNRATTAKMHILSEHLDLEEEPTNEEPLPPFPDFHVEHPLLMEAPRSIFDEAWDPATDSISAGISLLMWRIGEMYTFMGGMC